MNTAEQITKINNQLIRINELIEDNSNKEIPVNKRLVGVNFLIDIRNSISKLQQFQKYQQLQIPKTKKKKKEVLYWQEAEVKPNENFDSIFNIQSSKGFIIERRKKGDYIQYNLCLNEKTQADLISYFETNGMIRNEYKDSILYRYTGDFMSIQNGRAINDVLNFLNIEAKWV